MYYAENMSLPSSEQFTVYKSIPQSFWWCIVTLMTVGYGDIVPVTVPGKLVASMAMIVAIVIVALPISVIGTSFTSNWVKYKAVTKRTERTVAVLQNFKTLLVCIRDHNQARCLMSCLMYLFKLVPHPHGHWKLQELLGNHV